MKPYLKFLLPSLLGFFLFLFPVPSGDTSTIMLALITNTVRAPFEAYILEIIFIVVVLSTIGSGYYQIFKPDWKERHPALDIICKTEPIWFFMRLVGALFGLMVYFQLGPEIVWSAQTGYTVFTEIGATVFFIITVACFLMPFLTEFGFMEFIGTLVSRPFGFLFTLPGRSAVDALASFLTASNVGLLITIGQYDKGYYSAREASAIAVNFSVVSVSFSFLIASVSGIEHLFLSWYFAVFIACVLCAIIMVRIPPLSRIKDEYHPLSGNQTTKTLKSHDNVFKAALMNAVARAETAPSLKKLIIGGWHNALGVSFGVLAPSMAVGTITIILLTHTELFTYLSLPVFYLLEFLNFAEASAAAPGMIIGFLDQFMPALVASNLENELSKFVLAGLAVTQLIYMSEVGLLILRSDLPLKFRHLFIIFILRSIISFPVLMIAGLLIV